MLYGLKTVFLRVGKAHFSIKSIFFPIVHECPLYWTSRAFLQGRIWWKLCQMMEQWKHCPACLPPFGGWIAQAKPCALQTN